MQPMDLAFLSAAQIALDLLELPALEANWTEASSLEQMSVGMLACHLGRQVVRAPRMLTTPATTTPLPNANEHYRKAAWTKADSLDDPANDRTEATAKAAAGYEAMVDRCRRAHEEVRSILHNSCAQPIIAIPWQGWSLTRADYLLTRLVEIVVHADDLARSLDVETPHFPDRVYLPVLHLVAELAVERHGQAAMTSALTRRERMPATISAF